MYASVMASPPAREIRLDARDRLELARIQVGVRDADRELALQFAHHLRKRERVEVPAVEQRFLRPGRKVALGDVQDQGDDSLSHWSFSLEALAAWCAAMKRS